MCTATKTLAPYGSWPAHWRRNSPIWRRAYANSHLRVRSALADRLAVTGRLPPCDPELAAQHFPSLLTDPLEYRSDPDADTVADTALDVSPCAYGQ